MTAELEQLAEPATTHTRSQKADREAQSPSHARPGNTRRLVVELTRGSAETLARAVEDEEINKTTVVNRALALYAEYREAARNGDQILIRDGKTGELMLLRII